MPGKLIIFSAPSGAGKTTIVRHLLNQNLGLEFSISATSRAMRHTETMNEDEPSGRKLGFIAQEIGREINTLGSKANESNLQRIVVQMKDNLEKVKEQVLNVL